MSEFTQQPSTVEAPQDSRRLRRHFVRLGAFAIGAGLAAIPLATVEALQDTRVYDEIGVVPTTLEFSPNSSSLNLGPLGNFYNDTTRHNIGVRVTVDGPPSIDSKNLDSLISNSTLNAYTGIFHDPNKAAEGYRDALVEDFYDELLKNQLRFTIEIGALILALSSIRLKDERRRKQLAAVVMGGALLGSSGIAVASYQQWEDDYRQPSTTYAIPSLESTALAGTVADNKFTALLAERTAPRAQLMIDRQSVANDIFIESATTSLLTQADKLAAPEEGETAFLLGSDMHSNQAAINMTGTLIDLINEKFGEGTVSFIGLSGDSTYGSAAEKTMVDSIGDMGGDTQKITVRGNHDSDITKKQMESAGITVLNGETESIDGVSIIGADDPRLSQLFGQTTLRGETDPTTAAENVYQAALAEQPTLLMAHEAYDLAPLLDIGTISQASMLDWLNETDNYTSYLDDGIKDVPANLIVYGHWHRSAGQRVVWNEDGSWSVIVELGTSGGAIAAPTFTNFSTPWSPPGQDAVTTMFYTNEASGLVTGMQQITFRPDGIVDILPRLDIGSPDGQAYVLASQNTPLPERQAVTGSRNHTIVKDSDKKQD